MKSFNEIVYDKAVYEDVDVSFMTETELNESIGLYYMLKESFDTDGISGLETFLQEGFLGALTGFIVGPAIGKVIANALGVQKGILFDMLTSRLVSAALGSAIQKNL